MCQWPHQILTLLALAMPITNAFAADIPPTIVYVLNADEKSAISAECEAPDAGELKCHFTQMTIYKPDETQSESRVAKGVADLLKASATEFKDCGKFAALAEAVETGKAPPDVADKQKFESDWVKEAPQAKADTINLMKAFVTFCKDHDPASAEAVARASDELDSSTCKISNWTFDKTFTLNGSTKRWQSTVQNTDSCGTIDYSEFSKPDDPRENVFWNYTAKSIVTNPNGKTMLGASCSTVDQSEHRFTWQVGKFYANCRYVEITP